MINKRHTKSYLGIFTSLCVAIFMISSCSDNPSNNNGQKPNSNVITVKNLNAQTGNRGKAGKYTFYNLKDSSEVVHSDSATTKWDIAFSGRNIIVNGGDNGPGNGGVLVLDEPFEAIQKAPTTGYSKTSLDYQAWANYTGQQDPKHAFLPKENTTIVVKTADGNHVAKIKMISWYKDNPDPSSSDFSDPFSRNPGYFTFKYQLLK
jgi:hypothetical protein